MRSGISIELQFKAEQHSAEQVWQERFRQRSGLAHEVVQRRIDEIRQAYEYSGREFPDIDAPDTTDLEAEFQQTYRDMLQSYRQQMDTLSAEQLSNRLDGAQDFLSSRFRQQLDRILQPHYGINHFIWSGGGADPCGNCSAHQGQIGMWGASPAPPGCDFCRCYAAPYLGPIAGDIYADAIEPVYPEAIIPALRIGLRAWVFARAIVNQNSPKIPIVGKPNNLTKHGEVRWAERNITQREVQEAMKTAKESSNITSKIGKYGTLQHRYHGKNGVTVIVETEGRNAGKIVTYWRN